MSLPGGTDELCVYLWSKMEEYFQTRYCGYAGTYNTQILQIQETGNNTEMVTMERWFRPPVRLSRGGASCWRVSGLDVGVAGVGLAAAGRSAEVPRDAAVWQGKRQKWQQVGEFAGTEP